MKANLILLLSILALVGCHDRIIIYDVQTGQSGHKKSNGKFRTLPKFAI